jgi:hypothetical protein
MYKILYIGDSHTHGKQGAYWLSTCTDKALSLCESVVNVCTVEAGKDGQMACSIASRKGGNM